MPRLHSRGDKSRCARHACPRPNGRV